MWNSLKGITAPSNGDKGFNGNDLTITDIYGIREHLKGLFSCDSDQLIFKNIEIGVNLLTPFEVGTFLKGLLYHNGKRFEPQRNNHYWQCVHSNYKLKIYNKGHQYGMAGNVLRVEVQVKKMIELDPVRLVTFADVNTSTLDKAYQHLVSRFIEIVYYDRTIDKTRLTRLETIKIKDYSNVTYWMDMDSRKRDRHKRKLAVLIRDYSENLKAQISSLIIKKCVIINQDSESAKCVIINRSSISLKITHSTPKICPITGVDISMQKDDSNLLSNTGLRHLENKDRLTFDRIRETFLTGNFNKFENSLYDMISKQIRNRYYNNPDLYSPMQIPLF
jgi:hypothetical protein